MKIQADPKGGPLIKSLGRNKIMNFTQELFSIADTLTDKFKEFDSPKLLKVIQVAEDIGKSWSGSCLGYHSRVYYKI